ncbi:uncharacterized protein LOC105803059 isoform X2 [Gossypium raimondii]|uniref:uncharacterized protein LOC105803059 isoform X2 n=1 Tax=Gossypium raimondii TaxID=29730 RepID=UPI00063AC499|nr:uncharacterized protein LOC105803059 isoform X2 [Gossypium raimondii]
MAGERPCRRNGDRSPQQIGFLIPPSNPFEGSTSISRKTEGEESFLPSLGLTPATERSLRRRCLRRFRRAWRSGAGDGGMRGRLAEACGARISAFLFVWLKLFKLWASRASRVFIYLFIYWAFGHYYFGLFSFVLGL